MDKTHSFLHTGLKIALIGGIVIVLNLFFNYALTVFYPAPLWQDFCSETFYEKDLTAEASCTEVGGEWVRDSFRSPKPVAEIAPQDGFCDVYALCEEVFQDARDPHNRNVFIILVLLGVISIAGGLYLKKNAVLATGLSYGGVLSLVIGSIRFWPSTNDIGRLVILLAALLLLVALAVRKFSDK